MRSLANELVLGAVALALSIVALMYSLSNQLSDMQVLSFMSLKISAYIFTGSLFVKFLNGIGCDVNKEIFEEHNTGAAILVGLFWVGLGIAIAAGNLG